MSKIKNQEKLKFFGKFYRDNKLISILTLVAIIIIFSYYLTIDLPELKVGVDKWYKLLCDLSVGVLINFMFFSFQIYLPGIQIEKKAFLMIKSQLEIVCNNMQELILVIRHYFSVLESGKLQILEQKAYYKLIPIASSDGRGWGREFDFYTSLSTIKKGIDAKIEQITSNVCFSQNEKELIEIISKLQANSFLKDIEVAQNCKFNPTFTFGDISKSFSDFCFILERLKEFELDFQEKKLVVLSDTEKSMVSDRIKSSPEQAISIGIPHVFL